MSVTGGSLWRRMPQKSRLYLKYYGDIYCVKHHELNCDVLFMQKTFSRCHTPGALSSRYRVEGLPVRRRTTLAEAFRAHDASASPTPLTRFLQETRQHPARETFCGNRGNKLFSSFSSLSSFFLLPFKILLFVYIAGGPDVTLRSQHAPKNNNTHLRAQASASPGGGRGVGVGGSSPKYTCLAGILLDVCLNRNGEKTSRVFLALHVIQTGLGVLLFPLLH